MRNLGKLKPGEIAYLDPNREKTCHFCKGSLKERGSFHNGKNCTWINMPAFSDSHMECYIHFCVEESLKKIKESK